jgi:phosphatidate cytidylyltransferase
MGHIYMIILVFVCQTLVYREITSLFALTYRETDNGVEIRRDPWSKTLNWYFFTIANYFLYGETIIYYFKVSRPCLE